MGGWVERVLPKRASSPLSIIKAVEPACSRGYEAARLTLDAELSVAIASHLHFGLTSAADHQARDVESHATKSRTTLDPWDVDTTR